MILPVFPPLCVCLLSAGTIWWMLSLADQSLLKVFIWFEQVEQLWKILVQRLQFKLIVILVNVYILWDRPFFLFLNLHDKINITLMRECDVWKWKMIVLRFIYPLSWEWPTWPVGTPDPAELAIVSCCQHFQLITKHYKIFCSYKPQSNMATYRSWTALSVKPI